MTLGEKQSQPGPRPGRDLLAVIEAFLFVGAEPLDVEHVERSLGVHRATVEDAVRRLRERYLAEGRPYVIRREKKGYRLRLTKSAVDTMRKQAPPDRGAKLSRASIETLSIVAYRQPISRADIERLLGLDPSVNLRELRRRGLVTTPPDNKDRFVTTLRFLEIFGLKAIEDLPTAEDLKRY